MVTMLKTDTLRNERAVGYNIDQLMTKQNVTIEQLSELAQIPEMRIKAIVTGSVDVRNDELATIADKLGVDEKTLLQPVSDEELQNYNIHYMGTTTSSKDMNTLLDKVDMYVRLLNVTSDNQVGLHNVQR